MDSNANVQARPWSDGFEKVLRRHLPLLGADQEVRPNTILADLGLDSMSTVSLLIDLEDTLNISISDDELLPEVFRSPGRLWATVQRATNNLGGAE